MNKPMHPCTKDCPHRNAYCHTKSTTCEKWKKYSEEYDLYRKERDENIEKESSLMSALNRKKNYYAREKLMDRKRGHF